MRQIGRATRRTMEERGDDTHNGGGELLPGRLAAGGLAGGLLGTRHLDWNCLRIWVVELDRNQRRGIESWDERWGWWVFIGGWCVQEAVRD
jgi:hypothetical protein